MTSRTSNLAQRRVVIIAEESTTLARFYADELSRVGHRPVTAASGAAVMASCRNGRADLLLLNARLPDIEAAALIAQLRDGDCLPPTIIMAPPDDMGRAAVALRNGAYDILAKPFHIAALHDAVQMVFDRDDAPLQRTTAACRNDTIRPASPAKSFIGTSPAMQALYDKIEHAARSQATVFITGESGTGKELCAESVHRLSARADRPFIPINCAAIPRDLMESELFGHVKGAFTGAIADREGAASLADGGTLFLDEIAEMHPDMQTKLLRFLQDLRFVKVGGSQLQSTDVRIICATNRDPHAEISARRFREDLYYRLHVLPLHMPPLRERGEDIIDLAIALLGRYAAEEGKSFNGLSAEAEACLRRYHWPGNIRELQNTLRNIVVMEDGPHITAAMLPDALHSAPPSDNGPVALHAIEPTIRPLADIERDAIEQAIHFFGGNIPKAAQALGVSASTLYRKKAGWNRA